jgi:hypothetical protein
MNNPLEELEKRFTEFAKLRDPEEDAMKFVDYLLFIDETPPLNTIARKIFNDRPFSPIPSLYQAVKRAGQEPGKKIWLNLMLEINEIKPFISTFHMNMAEGAKQVGLTKMKRIILHTKKGSKSVCLVGETPHCYSIKRSEPERFKIIFILFKTETGKSAREIGDLLKGNGESKIVQDNIKKEIEKINILFQNNCEVSDELIVDTKSKGKNIYCLNRKHFIFQTEK